MDSDSTNQPGMIESLHEQISHLGSHMSQWIDAQNAINPELIKRTEHCHDHLIDIESRVGVIEEKLVDLVRRVRHLEHR